MRRLLLARPAVGWFELPALNAIVLVPPKANGAAAGCEGEAPRAASGALSGAGSAIGAGGRSEMHRVGPKFAHWLSSLTGNPILSEP